MSARQTDTTESAGVPPKEMKEAFSIEGSPRITGWVAGAGPDVVLCHGLSATSDFVLHGSGYLARQGFRVISWDARGHGGSEPSPPGEGYSYEHQIRDLDRVIQGVTSGDGLFLVGHSMGSHTALAWSILNPERVLGLVLVGPVYSEGRDLLTDDRWDERAEALRTGGPEAFARLARAEFSGPSEDRDTVERIALDRTRRHRYPDAVADALQEVPRSRPFEDFTALAALEVPTLVIGSQDSHDPGHPLATAREYADTIPRARFVVEPEGDRPLAWQGGRLSRELHRFFGAVADRGGG